MDRRTFLRNGVFAATAGLALDACIPDNTDLIPILVPEESFLPGVESWPRSTCALCPARCGIAVRKIDGRLVKVEGNPEHPVSRGGVCARGQALPQEMYHPDRIQGPLAREGARGEGLWRPISWEDAVARVAEALGASSRLDFVTPSFTGHRAAMVERFVRAFGPGRHLVHEPFPEAPLARAHALATGHGAAFGHDLARSGYVLALGAELLESHLSPVGFQRGLADLRQARPGRRGKLVFAGARLSLTAANADEWIPVRPGAELDVALAIAALLVESGQHDASFVAERSEGFAELRALFERLSPAALAERAEVPLERLARIASEMAAHRPALAIAGGPSLASPRGVGLALAASHLNALLGAYGDEGTLVFGVPDPPFRPWPEAEGPEPERTSLAQALEGGGTLGDVVCVAGADPLYSLPPGLGLAESLSQTRTLVSFGSFHDDTTRFADLVLPESASFERFEDGRVPGASVPMATLAAPLLARPLYDTRAMPDALVAIARAAGREDAFPWASYEEALRDAWSELGAWDAALERGGFWASDAAPERRFDSPGGRYRFVTEPLAAAETRPVERLELHLYASTPFGDGRAAHLPFLQELADPVTGARWGSVVEIAAATAAALGIADGDRVRLRSTAGELVLPAHVSAGLHPGVVALAAGQGHTDYGRYARGRGANGYALLAPGANEDGAFLAGTPVELERVESA